MNVKHTERKEKKSHSPHDNPEIRDYHRQVADKWMREHGDGSLKIDRSIGFGGFSSCWLVRSIKLPDDEPIALKVISRDKLCETQTKLIDRELSIFCKLDHPNIVHYEKHAYHPEVILIWMEYCHGGTLSQLVRSGPLKENGIQSIAGQLCSAIFYLHRISVLHRDIKPANIFISKVDQQHGIQVKLADFGLSIRVFPDRVLTEHCGTPYYFSPEMVEHKSYSYPTDVWSFGLTMYYCFVGRVPFYAESLKKEAIFERILRQPIEFPNEMSEKFISFLKHLLIRDPLQRATIREAQRHRFLQ